MVITREGPSGLMHGSSVITRPPKDIAGAEKPEESKLTPAATPTPTATAVPMPLPELLLCAVLVAVVVAAACTKAPEGKRSGIKSAVNNIRI